LEHLSTLGPRIPLEALPCAFTDAKANHPTGLHILKKLIALTSLLSAFAVSAIAQTSPARTPAESGAKLVAERDAAWTKAHPTPAKAQAPATKSTAKPAKQSKKSKSAKKKSKQAKPKI
jgi:hypothetical protein